MPFGRSRTSVLGFTYRQDVTPGSPFDSVHSLTNFDGYLALKVFISHLLTPGTNHTRGESTYCAPYTP